jgi:hypothetical protein
VELSGARADLRKRKQKEKPKKSKTKKGDAAWASPFEDKL